MFRKIVKATAIGTGVCVAALAAPLGMAAVVGITAAGAVASLATDSIGDVFKDEDNEKKDEDKEKTDS